MRLYSFTTCTDSDESIKGIQFVLSNGQYSDPTATKFELDPIGQMTGECNEMLIEGPLSSIRASYAADLKGLNGISYFRGMKKKTYGSIGDEYTEWLVTEDQPLVGLYGNYNDEGVERLGLITLDLQCQIDGGKAPEQDAEVISEGLVESVEVEEEPLDVVISEEGENSVVDLNENILEEESDLKMFEEETNVSEET